jgi:hypothetical protein
MKKALSWVLTLTFLLVAGALAGQEAEEKEPTPRHRAINLSLFYPLSLNSSEHDTADVSLSIFYNRLGSVRGLDLSLGVTGLMDSLNGVQVAGLVAAAGESMKGLQTAGLICVAGEQGEGLQIAGLGSVSGGKFSGVQVSGLFCVAGEQLKGAQVAGLFSVAGDYATGFQVSGLFSVAGEGIEGFQAAGLFNVAGENLKGVQVSGLFNVAGEESLALQASGLMNITGETCRGVQIGLFNVTEHLTGLQIGLINVAEDLEGVPVGLVNLTRKEDRRIRMAAWAGSASLLNTGAKIWAKNFYSILYVGIVNMTQEPRGCLGYGFHYGYGVPIPSAKGGSGRKMRVDVDAGYLCLDNSTLFRRIKGTPDRHVLSLRGAWTLELSPDVSVFAGTGLRYTIDYDASFGDGKVAPILFAGVELF